MFEEKFRRFVREQSQHFVDNVPIGDIDKETYARAIKLIEEVGELFELILENDNLQRKDKQIDKGKLSEEFADVIITTMMLAERMQVDVEDALAKKIQKVIERRK